MLSEYLVNCKVKAQSKKTADFVFAALDAKSQREQLIKRGIVSSNERYYVGGFSESLPDDENKMHLKLQASFRALYETMVATRDKIQIEKSNDEYRTEIEECFKKLKEQLERNITNLCGKKIVYEEEDKKQNMKDFFIEVVFEPIYDTVTKNETVEESTDNEQKFGKYSEAFQEDPIVLQRLFNAITNVLVTENNLGDDWVSIWEMAHKFHVVRSQIYRQMNAKDGEYDFTPFKPLLISGGEAAEDLDSDDSEDEDFDAFEAFLDAGSVSRGRVRVTKVGRWIVWPRCFCRDVSHCNSQGFWIRASLGRVARRPPRRLSASRTSPFPTAIVPEGRRRA